MRLSICIPVYNCAEFLGAALDSILPQVTGDVEVVVYDGGSTDGTAELMKRYGEGRPSLRYHRSPRRGGIDADLESCASQARGEYIWFFSGDDVMRSGAVERALGWCRQDVDVLVCKHTICTKQMAFLYDHPVLYPDAMLRVDLADEHSRRIWFQRSVTTEAFFSFISGLMVRRRSWESGRLPEEFRGSCWGHVARLFGLIPDGLTVCYVPEIWLEKRGENDSFADRGVVNRYRISVDGYHQIADRYFGRHSVEAFHIRKVIRTEFGLRAFLEAKRLCARRPESESRALLDHLVQVTYRDGTLRGDFARFVYAWPDWLTRCVRFVYRVGRLRGIERWIRKSSRRINPS